MLASAFLLTSQFCFLGGTGNKVKAQQEQFDWPNQNEKLVGWLAMLGNLQNGKDLFFHQVERKLGLGFAHLLHLNRSEVPKAATSENHFGLLQNTSSEREYSSDFVFLPNRMSTL